MKKRAAFALLMTIAFGLGCTKGCSGGGDSPSSAPSSSGGLQITDLKVGDGAEAVTGKVVTVHYTGTLTNGNKFDSSLDRNQPFTFNLGGGQVIKGWDQGVVGMKVHGKRKLVIPPDMAYGAQGRPPVIPPNSTLIFEIELLDVN